MKILYGVQGTGNGHISRGRRMAAHLQARGAQVTWLVSGRPREKLFDMAPFGDFLHRRGLTMTQVDGRVHYGRTLLDNDLGQFFRDVRQLDVAGYDLVITDFEPVTAWAARLKGRPCLGIGHQYAFKRSVPRRGDNLAARLVMRNFAPVNFSAGLHWHHFDTDILPPIVDTRLRRRGDRGGPVLVYLPFENQAEVTALLQRLPDYRFLQYAPALHDADAGNVQLRQTCLQGFNDDLCRASAVICNAGFELVSECLHMGLPVLVKPVAGQMEQLSNAAALEQLGWGATMERLEQEVIGDWLRQPLQPPAIHYPDVAAALTDWILAGEWQDQRGLWETLWNCTRQRAAAVG